MPDKDLSKEFYAKYGLEPFASSKKDVKAYDSKEFYYKNGLESFASLKEDVKAHDSKESYTKLRNYLNGIITSEIATGNYAHLRGPNTKGSKSVPINDLKMRVSIKPNPNYDKGDGKRNYDVNSLETMVSLQGPFVKTNDYMSGINIFKAKGDGVRVMLGTYFQLGGVANNYCKSEFAKLEEENTVALITGQYEIFVKNVMKILNDAVRIYKNTFGNHGTYENALKNI